MARNRPEERTETLSFFKVGEVYQEFAPWARNENGKHHYIKLARGEEKSFFFVGNEAGLRAEVQQALMRLVNDGWSVSGELEVSFDGRSEPGVDPYVYQEPLLLELGKALLPLADPQQGDHLMIELEQARDLIARQMGFVLPSVKVCDNLHTDPQHYALRVRGNVVTTGELFLDRYFAVASLEVLGGLEGWVTQDPVHRLPAKWIETTHREKAESLGCLVLGPLAVLMSHLKQHLLIACPELLGLQETYSLISRLKTSHPIVVEDFLENRGHLRNVRKVLRRLLAERVPIRDLVTILETCGDHLELLGNDEVVTRHCRLQLAREICSFYLNQEGVLRGLLLGAECQKQLVAEANSSTGVSIETLDRLTHGLKKTWDTHGNPSVLFTEPEHRSLVRNLLCNYFPDLGVLAVTEIAPHYKLEICGTVEPLIVQPHSDLV